MRAAAALAIFAIGLWATGVLPEHVTALGLFLFAMLFKVTAPAVIFSGFHSAALWLVFGGLVVGVAVRRTGLGERLAQMAVSRVGSSYGLAVSGVMAISIGMGFLMPSSIGRATLVVPVAAALAEGMKFAQGRAGRTGLVLAAAFGVHIPTFAILPANVPNMVLLGGAETLHGIVPVYGEYLLLHFPVLGVLKAVLIVLLILWLYPDRPEAGARAVERGPLSGDERRLAFILVLALGFWVSDFVHHVNPAWIGLAAALVCLAPGIGLVPQKAFATDISYGSMFYVAGIMGLGAMVADSGLGLELAQAMLRVLPLAPGQDAQNFAALSAVATLIGLATTLPGTPAVLTPLAGEMSRAAGWSVEAVLMIQVLGFSTVVLPYQSAPLVVGMQLGGERIGPAVKLCLILSAVTVLVLFPLDYLWWRLLGWI
ncbi:MAG: anion permease [Alphaproteobacteria bacterium]|nr:anion permease [Alphaproteobacteria bacterium]